MSNFFNLAFLASRSSLLRSFCAGLTAGLDMVLRARCIVTGAGAGTGDEEGPFLVSDAPDVAPALGSVLSAPELWAHPDAEGLATFPPVAEPEGDQLVLWGELSCACLVRINPLLPVTEPCGGSESNMPFSSGKVLLPVVEP